MRRTAVILVVFACAPSRVAREVAPPPQVAPRPEPAVVPTSDAGADPVDPYRSMWGLELKDVDGWSPLVRGSSDHFEYRSPASLDAIGVDLLESDPDDARALQKDADAVWRLYLATLDRVSQESVTPSGWSAIVEGPSRYEIEGHGRRGRIPLRVYVQIVRHGSLALMCHANLNLAEPPITLDAAKAVCDSLVQ